MLKKLAVSSLVILASISSTVGFVEANESQKFSYSISCKTRSTKWDGKRYGCYSDWSTHKVPSNFVFDDKSLKWRYTSKRGSTNRCEYKWSDYVELVPGTGLRVPRTLQIRAHARSPKGKFGVGSGWSNCLYTGRYVKWR